MAALIAAVSSPSMAFLTFSISRSTLDLVSASTLSPRSFSDFSEACTRPSALLRASTSSLRFLSSSACSSASCFIFSISSSERPEDAVIRIDCSLLVPMSLAETLRIPLASRSKETSICGTPRGAGGRSVSSKRPMVLLSAAISRSP